MRLALALLMVFALACSFAGAQDADRHPGWEPEPGDLDPEQNIALGKVVSFAPAPNYRLTARDDTDPTDLTDGGLSDHPRGSLWFQSKCVGWGYAGRANLALDLGQVEPIREIAIRIQGGSPQSGITTPVWMAAVVTDDGETWRQVGEYSTFRYEDDERFGVPAYEGVGWVHRFRFDDLETRGRHVGLSLYGTGLTVSDEMYVFRGEHDPEAVDLAAAPVVDFSVTRPQMHFHKPYVCFTTNVNTPNPVGVLAPPDYEGGDVTVTLELPPGVEMIGGTGFGRGDDAAPMAELEGEAIGDGWTRYEWTGSASDSTKTWGRLFLRGDWEDGREGELRYRTATADGESPLVSVPLRAIEVPETAQPEQFVAGLSWYSSSALASWPEGLESFRRLGFNTVSAFGHWIRDRDNPDNAAQWELLDRARAEGFRLLNIDSTFHRIPPEDETRCQLPDGTVGSRICPSYRGEYYEAELDRISSQCAMLQPDYLFADIEVWNWQGPVDSERCTRCQADFAASGIETLEEWKLEKGYEMWTDVVVAVDAGLAGAGRPPIEFGVYDWIVGKNYQFTWPFDRFYPDYLQSSQPSTYTPLYWYHIILVGDEARHSRELLPRSDVLPWITPGDAGTFDGERFRYALLECFANGSRGMNFWSGRVWDAELLAAYSRVLRNLLPVESIIVDGDLLQGAQVQGEGRISGMVSDGEMVILVADYYQKAGGAVTVRLPVDAAMTATDLDRGETLSVAADGTLTVPLEDVRARIMHVR